MQINNTEHPEIEYIARFKIVPERIFFWNFIANVVIVLLLLLIITFKPAGNPIPDETLEIILDFMVTTTKIFAGTYIVKFLGIDVNLFLKGFDNIKNVFAKNKIGKK